MTEGRSRHFTATDGLSLHFRDYGPAHGDALPLLCLTGLTRNSRDFDHIGRRHGATRRVICPDYRGRGRSARDPDPRNYRPETYLDDVRALLAALNLHQVVVVGTSMGGILAMAMAVLMPRTIAGAVLNDVGPDLAPSGLTRILDYVGTDRPQPDWPSAIACMRQLFPNLSLADEAAWRNAAEGMFHEAPDGMLRFCWDVRIIDNLRRKGAVPDLWPLFRALSPRPVLAIRGARSDVLSAETFARMKTEMPGLEQYVLPDVGHAPELDEPQVREVLDAFLARF